MSAYKESDFIVVPSSPAYDNLSEISTTIDATVSTGVSTWGFNLDNDPRPSAAESSTSSQPLQQPPLLGLQSLSSGCMQVHYISTCSWEDNCSKGLAKSSQIITFLDWDDGLFPTSEILERWRVPRDSAQRRGFHFSSAQQSLLDSWHDTAYRYLATLCKLSERCVIITKSRRPWLQECIDSFAPSLHALFSSPHGPHVVYDFESPEEGVDNVLDDYCTPSGPYNDADYHTWKLGVMRREAKVFYAELQGRSPGVLYDLDAIDELSFHRADFHDKQRHTISTRIPAAPTISQMTGRLLLDSQNLDSARCIDIPALEFNLAVDISGLDLNVAVAGCLDCPALQDRSPQRIRPRGRTKPRQSDFSHRQELHGFQADPIDTLPEGVR